MFEVGLEFDSEKINAVVFTQKRSKLFLRNCGFAEIEKHAVDVIKIIDPITFASSLKELWKNFKFKNKIVNIGISDTGIVVKEIDIPAVDDKEIDNAIRYQLEEFIPIPKENIIYDYYIIEKKKSTATVMLVGILKDIVYKIIPAFKSAGLKINSIEASCFSIFRLADYYFDFKNKYKNNRNKADCLVYFGNEMSIIELANITGLRYPRFIKSSVLSFKKDLIKKTAMASDEAEKLLKDFDLGIFLKEEIKEAPALTSEALQNENETDSVKASGKHSNGIQSHNNHVKDSIRLSANQLVNEISRSIEHFLQENRSYDIDNIYFCGRNIKNLEKYLAENLKYNLKRVDLTDKYLTDFLKKNRLFKDTEYAKISESILVSSGLALRGLKK